MQSIIRVRTTAFALFCLGAFAAVAQVRNQDAVRWYNTGVNEKDPQKAVAAYEKALALDSTFTEALFAIGYAYNNQKDFARAEGYLRRASRIESGKGKGDLKAKILFELSNSHFGAGDLNASAEALRQAKVSASDDKLKTNIVFKLARVLCQQNLFQEALYELRERRQQDSKNKDSFDSFISLVENEIAAAQTRVAENTAAKPEAAPPLQPQLSDSQTTLTQAAAPSVSQPVKMAEQAIEDLYLQALGYETANNLEMSAATYENLLQQSPNYKDARMRLQTVQRRLIEKQIALEAEQKYTEGLAALRVSDWLGAIASFEKTLELKPDFSEARQRLQESQKRLDQENTDEILARYYTEGLSAMRRGDLGRCLVAFEKVRKLDPNYREVAALLAQVESEIQSQRLSAIPQAVPRTASPVVDSLYYAALKFLQQNDWKRAVVTLEKLRILSPDNSEVARLLAQARMNLSFASAEMASVDVSNDTRKILTTAGAVLAVIVLPFLFIFIFSPSVRARLHLLMGDFHGASRIYERMLTQKPTRVELYPALANIYLLSGRRDENAMKVYKTVLQLDLPFQNREQINAVFTQHYLSNGRSDNDTIKALESAIQIELNRKSARRES